MRFQLLAARLGLTGLILAALIAGLAVAGARFGFFTLAQAQTAMIPAVALGLIALALALAWLGATLKHNRSVAKRSGLIALVGSLLLLWPPLSALYGQVMSPPIHDASTDPDDPPQFVALAKTRGPGMNPLSFDNRVIHFGGETGTVSYILHTFYGPNSPNPLTKPLALIMPRSRMFWRCFETAKRMGWHIVAYDEKQGRIEATASSFWFGRVSDIVIRVRPAGTMGARFDMRAESETGARDFGANLDLLKAYRAKLAATR